MPTSGGRCNPRPAAWQPRTVDGENRAAAAMAALHNRCGRRPGSAVGGRVVCGGAVCRGGAGARYLSADRRLHHRLPRAHRLRLPAPHRHPLPAHNGLRTGRHPRRFARRHVGERAALPAGHGRGNARRPPADRRGTARPGPHGQLVGSPRRRQRVARRIDLRQHPPRRARLCERRPCRCPPRDRGQGAYRRRRHRARRAAATIASRPTPPASR